MVNTGLVHDIWTVTAIVDIRPAQNIDPPPQASSNIVGLLLNQSLKLQYDLSHDVIIFVAFRVLTLATLRVSDVKSQHTKTKTAGIATKMPSLNQQRLPPHVRLHTHFNSKASTRSSCSFPPSSHLNSLNNPVPTS